MYQSTGGGFLAQYIVFFGLCGIGLAAFIIHEILIRKGNHSADQTDYERLKTESYIERRLYDALKRRGEYPQCQVGCGKYRIDIALVRYRLAIECDGKAYHSSKQQKAHDRRKNAFLKRHGWKVLRFTGSDINGKLDKVLDRIDKEKELRKYR